MAKAFKLNLLRRERLSLLAEVSIFVKYYAKYVIILTQLVVLAVFFVKVLLDQRVIDLKETIDQKNQIILTAESMIQNNNVIVAKTQKITTIVDHITLDRALILTTLANIPQSVTLKRFALNNGLLEISGETYEPADIKKLELRLRKELKDQQVTLVKIDKGTNIFSFDLTINGDI